VKSQQTLPIRHIVVALSEASWDEQALHLAARFARSLKAKLTVLHVMQVPPRRRVDDADEKAVRQAEVLLHHAEEVAREERLQIDTDIIQARDAGVGLVEAVRELGADLLIAAGHWAAHHPQLPLGETVTYLLRHAPCPVWLACEPHLETVSDDTTVGTEDLQA